MSQQIELRPSGSDDRDFLYHLYASTRDDVARAHMLDQERKRFLEMQFGAQQADYETRFPNAEHSVIVVDGCDVGRIWIDRRPDEIRLLDISLLPEHRNRGTGRELLRRLIDESAEREVALRHSVFVSNTAALRFYGRLGFSVIEDFGMYVLMEWGKPPPLSAD